jgi:predicted nucleic acid-binding protein
MKVFVDTNIIMDVLTEREPFYKNSAVMWTMAEKNVFNAYISAISVNNVYYIIKKLKGKSQAGQIVDKILEDFTIIALTYEILKLSRTFGGKDFEDVIQYFSAIHSGCDYIVTRNPSDFPGKEIKILQPHEFIERFG